MSQKLGSWPNKMALIISDSPNLSMFLRELLRSLGWGVLKDTASVDEAIHLINDRQAFLVIVDDTPDSPAAAVVRELLNHPAGFATPFFAFIMDENREEYKVLSQLTGPEVVFKPLTPSRFVPSFTQLVKRWETKPYVALRAGFNQYLLSAQNEARLRIFTMLSEVQPVANLAIPILSLEYRRQGEWKDAERVMLQYLKQNPRDVGSLVTLADLYLHAAMPMLSRRLLQSAQKLYPHSCCLMPDLVPADILLGDLDGAIAKLEAMAGRKYWAEQSLPILARLLHIQGRGKEAEVYLAERKGLLQKISFAFERVGT